VRSSKFASFGNWPAFCGLVTGKIRTGVFTVSGKENDACPFKPSQTGIVIDLSINQNGQIGNRIWLAQQLVELRTNRILWSGIYARPLFNSTQDSEDDTSLTIGS
jgi:hypothetical protein